MNENNKEAIELMEKFLHKLPNHRYDRAIDVACGAGHLTLDLLSKNYKNIDMFDSCPYGIDVAGMNVMDLKNTITVSLGTMEDFNIDTVEKANGIYLRWCVTYLS